MKFYLNGKRITKEEAKKVLDPIQFKYAEQSMADNDDAVCFIADVGVVDVEFNEETEEE